jgi:phosphate transport system substrate-binding protein
MKNAIWVVLLLAALLVAGGACWAGATINGAGASFPYPIYSQWARKYNDLTGTRVNYQSIGSGGGISQIKAKTVDFGASDAPLKEGELKSSGLVQFPMVIGGVVPVVNLPGVDAGDLTLTGKLLADIYLGSIDNWNDPAIRKLNPKAKLPDKAITVVHRSDSSGTTWLFTNYLDKVSGDWSRKVGTDKAVAWPAGIGAKGNEGVAAMVKQAPGSIGYVEYAYAVQIKLAYVLMRNREGKVVTPTIKAFQAAAANANWKGAPGFYVVLTDQPGDASWPITGASYILIQKKPGNAGRTKEMLKFFDWSYKQGAGMATELNYVPLPTEVVRLVESAWTKQLSGGKELWP